MSLWFDGDGQIHISLEQQERTTSHKRDLKESQGDQLPLLDDCTIGLGGCETSAE